MQYYWVTAQCEYATDILFRTASDLKELYPKLISHSMQYFGAKEVMSFLGKKLVGQFRGEVVNDMTDRCKRHKPGTRINHRAKMNWIKMYDKAGSVLRVETGDWTGDGEFDSSDLVLAFQSGGYVAFAASVSDLAAAVNDDVSWG